MDELCNLLKTLELPLAYHHFKTNAKKPPPDPPYLIYLRVDSDNFEADNKTYNKANIYHIELYTKTKDLVTEKLIEDLFDENDIYYDTSELYIESEGLYQVIYEITF